MSVCTCSEGCDGGAFERALRAELIESGLLVPNAGDRRGRAEGERCVLLDDRGRRAARKELEGARR